MLEEASSCIKCGAPVFNVQGVSVNSCACSKLGAGHGANPFTQLSEAPEEFFMLNAQLVEAVNIIKEILATQCADDKGNLSSKGNYPYAKAIKFLSNRNCVNIVEERGPVLKAHWK